MKWRLLVLVVGLGAVAGAGQRRGSVPSIDGVWTAESPVAMGMTGDLRVEGGQVTMVGHSFALRAARALAGEPLRVAGQLTGMGAGPEVTAVIAHAREVGNETSRLCTDRPVRWMVFVLKGREMQMAVFAGEREMDLEMAEARAVRLCGVYRYARLQS